MIGCGHVLNCVLIHELELQSDIVYKFKHISMTRIAVHLEAMHTPSSLILRLEGLRVSCVEDVSHVYPIEPACIMRSGLRY